MNFSELSNKEKRDFLQEILRKEVSMVYDYSDLPTGQVGPERILGKVVFVGIADFSFCFSLTAETSPLTIDGIVEIDLL